MSPPRAPLLVRKKAKIPPKTKIVVFCEGKTEEIYLYDFARGVGSQLIEVEAIGQCGVPTTVVRRSIERRKKLERESRKSDANSFDRYYSIWAMFDRDEHDDAFTAGDLAVSNGIFVAFSNPCFELWGYLHYCNCDADTHRHALQSMLKELMPDYDHQSRARFNYDHMNNEGSLEQAKKRAAVMRKRRTEEGDPKGCPYTSVDKLLDCIEEYAGKISEVKLKVEKIEKSISEIKSTGDFINGDISLQNKLNQLYKELTYVQKIHTSDS